ncbi:MAG: hypothetical protein JWM68_2318 [Verrucomicrobiales bacterium]|nr:hypothetical protein [Verrucomicrobiales bacterium]
MKAGLIRQAGFFVYSVAPVSKRACGELTPKLLILCSFLTQSRLETGASPERGRSADFQVGFRRTNYRNARFLFIVNPKPVWKPALRSDSSRFGRTSLDGASLVRLSGLKISGKHPRRTERRGRNFGKEELRCFSDEKVVGKSSRDRISRRRGGGK